MKSLIRIAIDTADSIDEPRDLSSMMLRVEGEMDELRIEALAKLFPDNQSFTRQTGPDGVFGEAIDLILEAMDIIRSERPNLTPEELEQEITAYGEQKCRKWKRKAAARSEGASA